MSSGPPWHPYTKKNQQRFMGKLICLTEHLLGGLTMTDSCHALGGFSFWCDWALKPKHLRQNKVSLKYLKVLILFSSFHRSLLVLNLVINSSSNFFKKIHDLIYLRINNLGLGCRLLLECLSIKHEVWVGSPTGQNSWRNLKINT